jgi:hypothetical protein
MSYLVIVPKRCVLPERHADKITRDKNTCVFPTIIKASLLSTEQFNQHPNPMYGVAVSL